MQVNPVSAIHALRIRPKPVTAPASNSESASAGNGAFGETGMVPAHVASAALRRDSYHGAHAEYAAQLLADRYASAETHLERQQHLAQYASAAEEERKFYSYSVSV